MSSAEVPQPVSHLFPHLLFLPLLRKCHSLIQDQARELTHLRQKMRVGRTFSSLLIQHVRNTVKTFEELLSSNKIDHCMEQRFREQLAKGSQLAESLASKFSTGKPAPGLRKTFSPSQGPRLRPAHIHRQVTFQSDVPLCSHHFGSMVESGLAGEEH